MVASDGTGMHALSSVISRKTPGRPRSPTTLTANSTLGSVMDASAASTAVQGSGAGTIPRDAPTDPDIRGHTPAPPFAAPARGRRGPGRPRVLPRLPAAVRRRVPAQVRAAVR